MIHYIISHMTIFCCIILQNIIWYLYWYLIKRRGFVWLKTTAQAATTPTLPSMNVCPRVRLSISVWKSCRQPGDPRGSAVSEIPALKLTTCPPLLFLFLLLHPSTSSSPSPCSSFIFYHSFRLLSSVFILSNFLHPLLTLLPSPPLTLLSLRHVCPSDPSLHLFFLLHHFLSSTSWPSCSHLSSFRWFILSYKQGEFCPSLKLLFAISFMLYAV